VALTCKIGAKVVSHGRRRFLLFLLAKRSNPCQSNIARVELPVLVLQPTEYSAAVRGLLDRFYSGVSR
jgi:hypothetical protein